MWRRNTVATECRYKKQLLVLFPKVTGGFRAQTMATQNKAATERRYTKQLLPATRRATGTPCESERLIQC